MENSMSERVLMVHYVLPDEYEIKPPQAICGEQTRLSILEGKNRHVRHVYITKSLHAVNCPKCMAYVGLLILADTDLGEK
jgi:hypothetical protein